MSVLDCIILYAWWIAPFTFVLFLAYTIKEVISNGKKDVTYAIGAGISLIIIVKYIVICCG